MMTRAEAKAFVEAIKSLREAADDKHASAAVALYPTLKQDGGLIKAGTRIRFGDKIKRAAVDLYDTAENAPDAAETLWEDILYREGERVIPEYLTAGLSFSKGELGWWGDILYRSLLDGNVWTPEQYPSAWEAVT